MTNTDTNLIFNDPFKQIILDDEIVDMVLEKVIQDPVYVENFSLYDSDKLDKEEFMKIFNQLVLKYKTELSTRG